MSRRHVIQAIFRRNFLSYFGSPTGYVFIAVFVILSAAMAFWRDVFFVNNLANLEPLNRYFPYLLLFFIPAVSMAIWAEERKQGTDELLLTLPATDLEIVLGKYFAALGIYTVALLFSLSHVVVLKFLGNPDFGVMIGTYLGYWFLGGALIAVAMTASLLTSSQTVAFILGALFCAVPVFLSGSGSLLSNRLGTWVEGLGVDTAFDDLASGVVSLRAVFYFVSLAALFIYVNLILLARRHSDGGGRQIHYVLRAASILVIGVAIGVLATRAGARVDLTQERLHTLSRPTRDVISKIDPTRPVYIQAYISPDVPESYVSTRETLIALLKEYDAIGGDRIHLRIVDTERWSEQARLAEDQFGIKPENVRDAGDGEEDAEAIYLGIAFTCGGEEIVTPFFHRGLSVEYELTRSIGTVSGVKRRRIGVAATDAKLNGGMDFQTMQSSPEWQILAELKKQYEVVQVGLDAPVAEKIDAMLVAQLSSLTQNQMNNLSAWIKAGGPALLFDDPFPGFNPRIAPNEPKGNARQQPMFGGMPPPPGEPKGDLAKFLSELGMGFPSEGIVWDVYNPHPRFRHLPREFLFVGTGSQNPKAFNPESPISSGLQEFVMIFGGEVRQQGSLPLAFTPLLQSSPVAGTVLKSELFTQNFFGMQRVEPRYRPRGLEITVAAHVKGEIPAAPPAKPGDPVAPASKVNVVFCADLDCISNEFFGMRNQGPEGLSFDNITFVMNAVDVLAGDETYVELRKRRPKHRTLETVEALTKGHNQRLLDETKAAEENAAKELQDAQARLDAKVDEVRKSDKEERVKEMEIANLQQVESKRFEVAKREIEDKKKAAVDRSKGTMKQSVSSIKKFIRNLAVFLAPMPAILMGIYIWVRRQAAQGRAS